MLRYVYKAVTVSPYARRQGVAKYLMDYLEEVSEKIHDAYYVDLFVRPSNEIALKMYNRLGYFVYQVVDKYYSGSGGMNKGEDAYDMRKSLRRDPQGDLSKPTGKTIKPNELEFH